VPVLDRLVSITIGLVPVPLKDRKKSCKRFLFKFLKSVMSLRYSMGTFIVVFTNNRKKDEIN